MPRRTPLLLLLLAAACGGTTSAADDFECEKLVKEYESLYVQQFGDHEHADFTAFVQRAAPYQNSDAPSCLTLQGLTETIENDRTSAVEPAGTTFDAPPVPRHGGKAPNPIALGFFGLMMLVSTAASLWLMVIAFQESVLWGLGYIFVPFVSIVFVAMHWEKSKMPFLVSVGSAGFGFVVMFATV